MNPLFASTELTKYFCKTSLLILHGSIPTYNLLETNLRWPLDEDLRRHFRTKRRPAIGCSLAIRSQCVSRVDKLHLTRTDVQEIVR